MEYPPIKINPLDPNGISTSPSISEEELDHEITKNDLQRRYYEVYFTCFVGTYHTTKYNLLEGDFVIVQADRGHDVGVVSRLVEFEVSLVDEDHEIVSVVPKDEYPVRVMLQDKVIAQNQALEICRNKCVELLISTHIEVIATEFQFDRKKLTIYIQFQGDVSVCRLVRKLYDIFKVRVKVIDIHNPHLLYNRTMKYLHASKLDVPFSNIYKKESLQNIRSEFRLKKAQLALQNNTQSNQHYFNPPVNRSPLQSPSPTPVPAPTPQVLSHQYSQRSTKMNFNKNHQQNERYSSIPHYPLNSNNLNNSTQNYDSSNVTVFESTFQSLPHRLENIHSNVNYHNSNNQHYSQSQYSNHKDFQTQFHPPIPPHTHQQYSSHQPFPTHPTPPTRNSYPLYSKMNFFS
mmetsp:Transcript_5028/g.5122  ORF Transcript_5028/g.5122 Transcript_5028/m.5122 type:complete len:402 (-) Transcript_5028:369-1574(-)